MLLFINMMVIDLLQPISPKQKMIHFTEKNIGHNHFSKQNNSVYPLNVRTRFITTKLMSIDRAISRHQQIFNP